MAAQCTPQYCSLHCAVYFKCCILNSAVDFPVLVSAVCNIKSQLYFPALQSPTVLSSGISCPNSINSGPTSYGLDEVSFAGVIAKKKKFEHLPSNLDN